MFSHCGAAVILNVDHQFVAEFSYHYRNVYFLQPTYGELISKGSQIHVINIALNPLWKSALHM